MIKLEVIIDYNVIVTHFIDTLSCWDYHVEKYVREYIEREYGITKEDEALLKTYVSIRKPLGWGNETELLNWAYRKYPDDRRFNDLLPIVQHFEGKATASGTLLSEYLHDKTNLIKANGYAGVSSAFSKKYEGHIKQLAILFDAKAYNAPLQCYLTYSPDEKWTMGGANGEGIYIELKDSEIKEGRILDDVILHEFLHKRISPHSYFKGNIEEFSRRSGVRANVFGYPDLYISLVEESIVYAVCDIIRNNKKTPSDKIQFYNENKRPEMVALWTTVNDIMPCLRAFLCKEASVEITRKELSRYFIQKLREISE